MKKLDIEKMIKEEIREAHIITEKSPVMTYSEAICLEAREQLQGYFHASMGGGYGTGYPNVSIGMRVARIFGYKINKGEKDIQKIYNKYEKTLDKNWEKFTSGQLKFNKETFPEVNLG